MESIYYNPRHPAAFGGVQPLKQASGDKIHSVKRFLNKDKTYRKFFVRKFNFERARMLVASMAHVFAMDLFEMQKYSRNNKGYRYILLIVDCFSRYIKAKPLKNKTGSETASALREIFEELRSEDRLGEKVLLNSDLGNEFWNDDANKVYETYGVFHYALRKPLKSNMAEISGRHLLDRIYKFFHHTGDTRWVDKLDEFVAAKNKRTIRSIGMAPNEVNYENQVEIYKKLYPNTKQKEKPLEVGSQVQISLDKLPYHKSFRGYFDDKVYEIKSRVQYRGIYRYTIMDTKDKVEISGSFYRQELLPINFIT